jgi:hypothetical protein
VSGARALAVSLTTTAHVTRTARKTVRRFAAEVVPHLVDLVGHATVEATRALGRETASIELRCAFDPATAVLRVEIGEGPRGWRPAMLPVLSVTTSRWGTTESTTGTSVWFEVDSALQQRHERRL